MVPDMSILREKTVWTRRRTAPLPVAKKLHWLPKEQQANIRKALVYLQTLHGGSRPFAAALGVTQEALWKMRSPSRQMPIRRATMIAALAGVDIGQIVSGEWPGDRCPHCGGTGKATGRR